MRPERATSEFRPLLESRRTPWGSFGLSLLLQGAGVIGLVNLAVFQTPQLLPVKHYRHVELVAAISTDPPSVPKERVREFVPAPMPKKEAVEPPPTLEVAKAVVPPVVRVPELPRAPLAKFDAVPAPAVPKPLRPVEVDVLASAGSSALPTVAKAPRQVQTGGFGDPNGLPANPTASRPNVARVGQFDLPAGPGAGNGVGGARGRSGVVASAGFGNGIAMQQGGASAAARPVRQAGFDQTVAAPVVTKAKLVSQQPALRPVLILDKPNPAYTEDARKLGIEGEVLLDVVFSASGDLRVLRVVRGLGHGLDEAAIHAAEHIRFVPASRAGQAVDSEARLHIVFQLS